MKQVVFLVAVMIFGISSFAQEKRDAKTIKKELSETKEQISKLQDKAKALQTEMDELPGWKFGTFGTIGVNLSQFSNWYSNTKPDLSEGHIHIVQNTYAKLNREKYFWINNLNINVSWKHSYNKNKDAKDKGFELKTDVFKLNSLFGYKLSKQIALSALADYNGSFIEDFADPSFFVVALGASWKPFDNFYLTVSPLGYEFIFANKDKDYKSSMGVKFLADYTRKIGKFNVHSNLTAFLSYKSIDYSSWTWTNSCSYTLWKKIGIGFNFGLRQHKQEAYNSELTDFSSLKDTDNELQFFWTLGMSYVF